MALESRKTIKLINEVAYEWLNQWLNLATESLMTDRWWCQKTRLYIWKCFKNVMKTILIFYQIYNTLQCKLGNKLKNYFKTSLTVGWLKELLGAQMFNLKLLEGINKIVKTMYKTDLFLIMTW